MSEQLFSNFTITEKMLNLIYRYGLISSQFLARNKGRNAFEDGASRLALCGYLSARNEGVKSDLATLLKDAQNGPTNVLNRDAMMFKNASNAYKSLPDMDPFSLIDFRKTHQVLNSSLLSRAGTYRNKAETVFHDKECVFTPISAKKVPVALRETFSWVKEKGRDLPPVILGAIMHLVIVLIHPFTDGNCQIARFWQELYQFSEEKIFIGECLERSIYHNNRLYFAKIGEARKAADASPFVEFILMAIIKGLESEMNGVEEAAEKAKYIRKLLSKMAFGIPYTAADLLKLLGLRSKETLRRHYLLPAIELGLIGYVDAVHKRSKNQAYIRK